MLSRLAPATLGHFWLASAPGGLLVAVELQQAIVKLYRCATTRVTCRLVPSPNMVLVAWMVCTAEIQNRRWRPEHSGRP